MVSKKVHFWGLKIFLLKMIHMEVILCGESIARISEAWKRCLDPDSGNEFGILTRKSKNFYFRSESIYLGVILCGESIATFFLAWQNYLAPDSGNGVGIRAKKKFFRFSRQYTNFIPRIRVKITMFIWWKFQKIDLKFKQVCVLQRKHECKFKFQMQIFSKTTTI